MNYQFKILLWAVLILISLSRLIEARQQGPEVVISQIHRNIAEVTDTESIQRILDDFLIAADIDDIERIEIIDISNIGFGDNDVLVLYPSLDVYLIDQPSSDLLEEMRGWRIAEQRRDASNELDAQYFYPFHADTLHISEIEESQIELVQNSVISDLLESLNRNYTENEISLRFERDEEGFTFQMWNYNDDAFLFSPRPPATPDTVTVNDFLYVLYSDSTIVADTTLYDIIYINKTVEETVYLPREEETETIQTQRLPGADNFHFSLDALNLGRRTEPD